MTSIQNYQDKIIRLEEVTSTNDYLKGQIEKGSKCQIVISKSQTKGRGQGGKSFFSLLGGLYLSIKIIPKFDIKDLSYLTGRVGLKVSKAIKVALGKDIKIKWINDIIYKNKKAGGILIESKLSPNGGISYVIIGLGLNLLANNDLPQDLSDIYTSLETDDLENSINKLLDILIPGLYSLEDPFEKSSFIREYNEVLFNKNKEIKIDYKTNILSGILLGINENMEILVKVVDEIRTFSYQDTKILY